MTRHAQTERELLCDELDRLGPDAPTLCEGWQTKDLAAHLRVREARPDLAVGIVLPFLADRTEREQRRMAAGDYDALVAAVRSGAPRWNPTSVEAVDEMVNLIEFFVHHEDVRRAQPGWEARDLSEAEERALWAALRRMARLLFRRSATGVVLVGEGVDRRYSAKLPDDHGTVVVRGRPGELVLFAYGRGDVAQVELVGDPADVEALQMSPRGV